MEVCGCVFVCFLASLYVHVKCLNLSTGSILWFLVQHFVSHDFYIKKQYFHKFGMWYVLEKTNSQFTLTRTDTWELLVTFWQSVYTRTHARTRTHTHCECHTNNSETKMKDDARFLSDCQICALQILALLIIDVLLGWSKQSFSSYCVKMSHQMTHEQVFFNQITLCMYFMHYDPCRVYIIIFRISSSNVCIRWARFGVYSLHHCFYGKYSEVCL